VPWCFSALVAKIQLPLKHQGTKAHQKIINVLFNSIHFLIFLPIVFTLYWALAHKYRWMLLLFASYYFYMTWSVWFGIILSTLTLISYYSALKITQTDNVKIKKRWLWFGILCNLGCLFLFKYLGFFSGQSIKNLIIPIGLSFYTFRLLSYIIDVYRGKAEREKNIGRFALFASFFPVILSGPIERFSTLMPQLFAKHNLNFNSLAAAVRIATWGYFKKIVIADRLAEFVNPVFAEPQHYSGLTLLIVAFFFVVQLYADFSGYTDIVTGIARLFGIELSINWRRPLLSHSLVSFWKRYHISLTSWFHDYLYLGVVGNSRSYTFWLLNIFVVFVISGLWHGASLTFVMWGAMHGIVYLAEVIISKKIKLPKSFSVIGWFYVILFHALSLIAFRANSINDLGIIYKKIFAFNYGLSSIRELVSLNSFFPLLVSIALILFLFMKELSEEFQPFKKLKGIELFVKPIFYILVFVLIFVLGKFNAEEFIYTHF
jgi:alginate O-acetyltransferase complex protein AlgI